MKLSKKLPVGGAKEKKLLGLIQIPIQIQEPNCHFEIKKKTAAFDLILPTKRKKNFFWNTIT